MTAVEPESTNRRVAWITGSASGIGRATAIRLAQNGCAVAVNDLTDESLEETLHLLDDVGAEALALPGDVTSADDVSAMVNLCEAQLGDVEILVNNAGVLTPNSFLDISEQEWDWVMDVTLKGSFLCTQAVVSGMADRGWGRIINMSSTAGKNVSTIGGAHYTTAKTAVVGLTRAVANEFAAAGVTVNAVCPGLFDTDMMRRTIDEEQAVAYANSFPIPRLGRPEEVAELIAFLASDAAEYMTGATFDINGGDLMV